MLAIDKLKSTLPFQFKSSQATLLPLSAVHLWEIFDLNQIISHICYIITRMLVSALLVCWFCIERCCCTLSLCEAPFLSSQVHKWIPANWPGLSSHLGSSNAPSNPFSTNVNFHVILLEWLPFISMVKIGRIHLTL